MRHPRSNLARLLAVLAVTALAATACGGGNTAPAGSGGGGGGSLAAIDLSGAELTVGSKEFTEQVVLGQIALQALEAAGANVTDRTGITGTTNVRTALTAGEIDMYWEYTGTGWTTILKHESAQAAKDPAALYEAVKTEDAANQIAWLPPAPLNNTYAIATEQARGQQLGVTTMTEYAALVARDPAQSRMCAAAEFLSRDDGFPGLEQAYGFTLAPDAVAELELALIPAQVKSGEACNFGEVFATNGDVAANNLVIVEDDKQYFVAYNAALTVRQDALTANPKIAEVFEPISKLLTSDVMRALNERAEVKGELPEEVAQSFLRDNGFIA